MLRRTVLAVACAGWLGAAMPAVAEEPAFIILKSGERLAVDLMDLGGVGFTVRVNGEERRYQADEVAQIEFPGAAPVSNEIRNKLNAGQPFLVLKSGQTLDGRLVDIGGTRPLRLTVETSSGTRDLSSDQVAHVFLSKPPSAAASTRPAPEGAVATDRGTREITLQADQPWTNTNVQVQEGDTLAFRVTGNVQLSANQQDRASAAGIKGQGMGPGAPMAGAPKGALLGRIDDGAPFLIGGQQMVRMPASGTLHFGFNDDMVSDNSGNLQIRFAVARRR